MGSAWVFVRGQPAAPTLIHRGVAANPCRSSRREMVVWSPGTGQERGFSYPRFRILSDLDGFGGLDFQLPEKRGGQGCPPSFTRRSLAGTE